jgi:ribosomal protein S18 acetylase RimI-like enzyme
MPQIRRAVQGDVEPILAFARAVVPSHYGPILGEAAAWGQLSWWSPERIAAGVAAGHIHVAIADGAVVGVVETGAYEGEYVIWKLYLTPEHRGRGLGARLLRAAVGALPPGTDHVLVEHFAGNVRAAAFYEREGFTVVDADSAADDPAALVWRRLDLEAPK